jgi:UDPglucose--hexose-1-phosphate uridylyltransferase
MNIHRNNNIRSQIRRSYLGDKVVIITPGRQLRPRDIVSKMKSGKPDKECPFCPELLKRDNTIVDRLGRSGHQVISLKNLFPALTPDNPEAYGFQEVIVDVPDHGRDLADFSESEIINLLNMYARRSQALAKLPKINYILCFKNQGAAAGASLAHAHSQVFASAITPPDLKKEARLAGAYCQKSHSCVYCDILKKEARSERLIFSDRYIVAFAPFASEYHYEAWIFPRRHIDNITLASANELQSLARALKLIAGKLKVLDLPFNYFLHNVISNNNQHLYIKIQPRDNIRAGVELGSGFIINSVPPETAAEFYSH